MSINQAQGMGLLEFLVSLTISIMIFAFLMHQFVNMQQQVFKMNALTQAILEKTWVSELIRKRIQSVGFTPCRRLNQLEFLDTRNHLSKLSIVQIFDNRLILHRMEDDYVTIQTVFSDGVILPNPVSFSKNVILTDCFHAEVHEIDSVNIDDKVSLLYFKLPIVHAFQCPCYLGAWLDESFYVKNKRLYYAAKRVDTLLANVESMVTEWVEPALTTKMVIQLEQGSEMKITANGLS